MGLTTVKRNGSPYAIGPLCFLSVLSATLVYCGQTVEWLKMTLSMEVSLGAGHIVLDGDPGPRSGSPLQKRKEHCPFNFPSKWGTVDHRYNKR